MRNSYSANAVRSAVTSALTNPFTRSLMISMLMTGFDGSVLIVAGRWVFDPSMKFPGWRLRLASLPSAYS